MLSGAITRIRLSTAYLNVSFLVWTFPNSLRFLKTLMAGTRVISDRAGRYPRIMPTRISRYHRMQSRLKMTRAGFFPIYIGRV